MGHGVRLGLASFVVVAATSWAVLGGGYVDWTVAPAAVAITVWNLLPIAGMAVLAVIVVRRWRSGLPVARAGVVALSAITAYAYWWLVVGPGLASSSWHSGLLSLILPGYLWVIVGVTAALSLLMHRRRHGSHAHA